MITAVPATLPVTIPVVSPIDAIPGILLDHRPLAVVSAYVVVSPTHTLSVPVIGPGNGTIVTCMATRGLSHPATV